MTDVKRVIESLREPTKEMLLAGMGKLHILHCEGPTAAATAIWQAMFDAAPKEKDQPAD